MSRQSNQYSAGYGHNRVTSGDNYATYNNHPNGRVVNSPSNNSERPHSRASSQSTYAIPSQGPPPLDGDDPDNPTAYFEKNRIKSLQSERIGIQKKTFTKWCNSYLCRARLEIDDLFIDLGDGILLLKFLEIISGKKLQKPNRGHMRVQKIENLNNCFHFLKANGIQLTNIGAEDILDGNETLILGLIWVIILRFSISEIAIIDDLTGEKRQAKDALLQWCKVKVAPYSNVKMENFTSSWKNGLAFNALIHAHRPELINYSSLNGNDAIGTLNNAFEVAEKKLEIARLLDAEDISRHADEKSIVTYVSMYYHYFAKQKTEDTAARRVAKIVGNLMEQDRLEEDYEALSSDILTWIRNTITWLENDHLPPSLNGIQNELAKFNVYRVQERPPKYKEVGELEAKYFEIQTKRKALARKAYVPPGGRMIKDVQDAWAKLDTAENEKQMMLINELRRQERLEQCAMKFFKKAQIREQWIRTKFVAIESCESNKNVAKINESVKKIEALSAEIRPQVTKFTNLSKMATELENEHYHDYKNISKRDREITNEWKRLLYNLSLCEQELNGFNNLTNLLRDLDELENELLVIQKGLKGAKIGDHLLGVDYFLEQHNLLQSEIRAKQVLLHKYEKAGEIVSREKKDPSNVMSHKLVNVKSHYEKVQKLSQERSDELIKARRYFLFIQNFEEELGWIEEKNSICEGMLSKRDITTFQQTSKQFKFLDTEMQTHSKRVNELLEEGQKLLNIAPSKDDMRHKMDILQAKFDQLRRLTALLAKWIEDAERARRYFQDANEAESWINEKMPLAKSSDYGRDIANSESLLSRHKSLVEEIDSYKTDIQRLDEAAEKLANTQFTLSNDTPVVVTEDLEVPKIKVNFSYKGEGGNGPFSVQKDEIVALMEKSNDEWWRVLRQTGEEGYIPANHCKILPGEKVTITQQVQEASLATNSQDKVAITTRQEKINSNYRKLCRLAEKRRNLLIDATKMFKFYNECEAFKEWAKDTRVVLEEPIPQAHIEIYRIKFDRLTSDIKAKGGTQLKNINDMADALISDMHSQSDDIRDYKDQINLIWNDLQKLVKQKGIELEILEKVKNFTDDCTELQNWMSGKYALLQEQVDDNDLEGLRNMQRRYQNLERDLAPLKKKMADLKQIAEIIKKNHPEYADMVDKMIKDLSAHHERLLRHAEEKINSAKQGQEQQIFDRNANKLAIWLEKTSFSLQEPITANMSAEDLLKRHGELWNEIEAKQFEFSYLNDVGNRISNDNKHLEAIRARCHKLDTAYIGVKQNWERRKYDIEKLMDLRLFNLEAERIDACTKGHEAFLNLKDLGDSVEGVEGLLKRHRDFESKLNAQEERLITFSKNADLLMKQHHPESTFIDKRRHEVLRRRGEVFEIAALRNSALLQALSFQALRRDAYELNSWISEKKGLISQKADMNDSSSLRRQLQKHEKFSAELYSNLTRLQNINNEGEKLIATNHSKSTEIKRILSDLNAKWKDLCDLADFKKLQLAQANSKKGLEALLNDANDRVDETLKQVSVRDYGTDLQTVKKMIHKHNAVETEIVLLENRVNEIREKGQHMVNEGHYDSENILSDINDFITKFNGVGDPTNARKKGLEESLKWHQHKFDCELELQYIFEKRKIIKTAGLGNSLTEATNLLKRHEQLETEIVAHQSHIEETIGKGKNLISQNHFAKDDIKKKSKEIESEWNGLLEDIEDRKKILEWCLEKELFLFDIAEVESWISEKTVMLQHLDTSNMDESSAMNASAKLKALESDMITYKDLLTQISKKNVVLCSKSSKEDAHDFKSKEANVRSGFEQLQRAINEKKTEVGDFLAFCRYRTESSELETWINEQLKVAMSDDYGRDYEHLDELKTRFDEFVQNVRVGSERFVQCEEAVGPLLENNPSFAPYVLKRQENLRAAWKLLLDYIDSRNGKLLTAEELHKFNRDVDEMLQNLVEKKIHISANLGSDYKQTIKLKSDHEVYQNEVIAMEKPLQSLLEEGAKLRDSYPGEPAQKIEMQLTSLAEAWNNLTDAVGDRRSKLIAAYNLQRFNVEARDLIAWSEHTTFEMMSEQTIKDLQVAEYVQKEHERLQAEIVGREADFDGVVHIGQKMIEQNHYAKKEIGDRIYQLQDACNKLNREWGLRNQWLRQVVQFHTFQREAKQIISVITTKENTIKGLNTVTLSVTDVENQLKKLETQKKAIVGIEKRINDLNSSSAKLIGEGHMEAANITKWQKNVNSAFNALQNQITIQEKILQNTLDLAYLDSDIKDMSTWIDEKQRKIDAEKEAQDNALSLEEKMKLLQKHQAIEAELLSNKKKIDEITTHLTQLKSAERNDINKNILHQGDKVLQMWRHLTLTSRERSAALEEARDLLNFNQLVSKVLHWIQDKELMLQANDMGRDLEHCEILIDKLVGTRADVSVDESTVENIKQLGARLIKQGTSQKESVHIKLDELVGSWMQLKGRMTNYKQALYGAKEVHRFNRDVDDTNERIHEKFIALQTDDVGRDLSSVSSLLRKQDAIERDMTAIHAKLQKHDTDAEVLLAKEPPLKDSIITSLKKLEVSWQELTEAIHTRRHLLQLSSDLHKYFDDVRKTEQWSNQMRTRIVSHLFPKSVTDANSLLESHHEKWIEIENRQVEHKELREYGQRIVSEQPSQKNKISRTQLRLQNEEHQLRQCWESEQKHMLKYLEIQQFYEQVMLTESWLSAKEAIVAQNFYGDSLEAVNILFKNHENFTGLLNQQSDKITHLKAKADPLENLERNDAESERVFAKYYEILQRYDALILAIKDKHDKLLDSRALHDFIKTNKEFITWMNAKLQLAYDDTFIDSTNLKTKLQKHVAFDSELSANEGRLQAIIDEGDNLVKRGHAESEMIATQLDEVRDGWQELKLKSAKTLKLLRENYEVFQIQRKLNQLDKWMDQIEITLSSDDHGKDVPSVEALMKRHSTLQTEISARKDNVDESVKSCYHIRSLNYDNANNLIPLADQIKTRYYALDKPSQIRKENLEDALIYYSWIGQANDEVDWMYEMISKLSSKDYGNSVQLAQSLNKKHQILQQEVGSRENALNEIQNVAFKMIKNNHFASDDIRDKLESMNKNYAEVNNLIAQRQKLLAASFISQQYYTEANEAEQWIRDRLVLTSVKDTINDNASAESHLRRLAALENEVSGFMEEVKRLDSVSNKLVNSNHFDSEKIKTKQNNLNRLFNEIQENCTRSRYELINTSKYYIFVNNVESLSSWLSERERMASSEDYGSDLEECLELIEIFEQVIKELSSAGERVAHVQKSQAELLDSNHSYSASINSKGAELTYLWQHVNDLANERQQALNGAKLVHKFDQTADQTMSWLQDKEAMMAAMEEEELTNIDLDSIKMLCQKHEVFITGLSAVEKKVDELRKSASRLQQQFPATENHISVRIDDMVMQLDDIKADSRKYKERLMETEKLQAYFQEYRDLIAFVRNMLGQITSEVLPRDVAGCEALNGRHSEYRQEIESRTITKDTFVANGNRLISNKHVLSAEISSKIEHLGSEFVSLVSVWKNFAQFYNENLDLRQWLHETELIDKWLNERRNHLMEDWHTISSVETAEQMIRSYDDFLVTLNSQEDKVNSIKRLTLLEQNYKEMLNRQSQIIQSRNDTLPENRRDTQAIKIMEKKDIIKGKRADRERRRTQEVSIIKKNDSVTNAAGLVHENSAYDFAGATLPRSREKTVLPGSQPVEVLPPSVPMRRAPSGDRIEALRKSTEIILNDNMLEKPQTLPRKMPTRTPSFSTRRTQSIVKVRNIEDLKAIDMKGYVERKHDLQAGGKKTTKRSWKHYYMILCGQLLCFFKDEESLLENSAASPPIYILGAQCRFYPEYVKRKNTFKVTTTDGSEYLIAVAMSEQMQEWIRKIQFHALLTPSNQLKSFDSLTKHITPYGEMGDGSKPTIPAHRTVIEEES